MCIFVFSLFLLAVKSPKSLESGSPNSVLLLSDFNCLLLILLNSLWLKFSEWFGGSVTCCIHIVCLKLIISMILINLLKLCSDLFVFRCLRYFNFPKNFPLNFICCFLNKNFDFSRMISLYYILDLVIWLLFTVSIVDLSPHPHHYLFLFSHCWFFIFIPLQYFFFLTLCLDSIKAEDTESFIAFELNREVG